MSLLSEQANFKADEGRLCDFIRAINLTVTGGELERTQELQDLYFKTNRSKTLNSMHSKKCAIDLNIFERINDKFVLLSNIITWEKIGDYWKSLDKKNRWGGDFPSLHDYRHFERKV